MAVISSQNLRETYLEQISVPALMIAGVALFPAAR
jgi:hypothetical protein